MQHLSNFCKMRHHIGAHRYLLTSRLTWTYGQKRSLGGTVVHRRPLLTLDPKKLSTSDHFPRNVSGNLDVSYTVRTRNTYLQGITVRYTTLGRRYIPFPENTCGFLYYQDPRPGNPEISGSLRFRVISESGPKSFENGVDLKLPTGGVWQIHLYSALKTLRHVGLVFKLLEEGLVTPSIIEKLRAMPPLLLRGTSQILYNLEDPFVANIHTLVSLTFMSDNGAESGQIMPLFFDSRVAINKHPYEGTVLARFERSTLPEHNGTRTIVLRILDILAPVQCVIKNYDSYIAPPTSGNLLSGHYLGAGKSSILRPWSSNLDIGKGKTARMISLLWPSLSGKDSNSNAAT